MSGARAGLHPAGRRRLRAPRRRSRQLLGDDRHLDIESVRQARDGSFWFGEELGPFLVHTDATGTVLEAPILTPGSPYLGSATPNLNRSSGFEGMAISADGRTLYPFLEGAVIGDDPAIRRVFEFDLRRHAFTGRTWTWRIVRPGPPVSDVTLLRAIPAGSRCAMASRAISASATNISGSRGRNPARDDDSDVIKVRVPGLSR